MADSNDYLIQDQDHAVLSNLAEMGQHYKKLKNRLLQAEAEYKMAVQEFETYGNNVLATAMLNAGVSRVDLIDGGTLEYTRRFHISPNKNATDRKIIADWLRQHGGDNLIKSQAAVDTSAIPTLEENGIPYMELAEVNSNSLKAFIKDKIGASGGVAQLTIDDIPAQIHFQEVGEVTIEL
jgi:hypothetical protein